MKNLQRPPAELRFKKELQELKKKDKDDKPPGWQLSLRSVRKFILGDKKMGIEAKFVGNPSLVDRAMVTLATQRGLLLIGEPGTAKSLLSELLAAAISGNSTNTIQGGAATNEDQIKYSWNYALLVSEGPSSKSLVPAPIHKGLSQGQIVRFEEITRCPLEVQDSLLSILSDRVMAVPELQGDDAMVFARPGFNLIATANTRDLGVNEMSAALKRRLNFETIFPISDFQVELELVKRESDKLLEASGVPVKLEGDMLELLVRCFRELRGQEGNSELSSDPLSSVLSTAEAVTVAHSMALRSWFLRQEAPVPEDLIHCIGGTAVKDDEEDQRRLRRYLEQVVGKRQGPLWKALYKARHEL